MTWDKFRFYFLLCALLYAAVATLLNLFLTCFTLAMKAEGWKGYIARTVGYLIVTVIMFFFVVKYR